MPASSTSASPAPGCSSSRRAAMASSTSSPKWSPPPSTDSCPRRCRVSPEPKTSSCNNKSHSVANPLTEHLPVPTVDYNNQVTHCGISSQVRPLVKKAAPDIWDIISAEVTEQTYNDGSDIRVQ